MMRRGCVAFFACFALIGSAWAQGGGFYSGGGTYFPVFGNPRVYANVEQLILQELNDLRAQRGLPPLWINPDLKEIARERSRAQATGAARGFVGVPGGVLVEGARVEMTRQFARDFQQARESVRQLLQNPAFQRALFSRAPLYVGVGVIRDLPGRGILFTSVALSDRSESVCLGGAPGLGGPEEPFYPGPGFRGGRASQDFDGGFSGRGTVSIPSEYGLRQDVSLAREILAEINNVRAGRGLPPLENDPGLAEAASFRAIDISTGSTQQCNLGAFDLSTRLRLMGLNTPGVAWEGTTSFPMDRARATAGAQFAQTLDDFFQSESTGRFLLSGRVRFAGVSVMVTPEGYVTAVISASSQPTGARGGFYGTGGEAFPPPSGGFEGARGNCRQVTTINNLGQRVTRWVCPR